MCVFQKHHPRLGRDPTLAEFMEEQHIFITAAGTGHPHQIAERSLEEQLPARNIIAHVPSFTAAAILAKATDAVATMPGPVASVLARELDMQLAKPPIKLPEFDIAQYWHERFDRDPGNQWLRSVINTQFGGGKAGEAEVAPLRPALNSLQAATLFVEDPTDVAIPAGCRTKSYSNSQNGRLDICPVGVVLPAGSSRNSAISGAFTP